MALVGGGTQESILPARGGRGRVSGGGQGGAGSGAQPGDRRWELNNVGLLEEQVWTGSRWMATGQVRNPVEGAGDAAGRTQFESERALDEARAREALARAKEALAAAERTGDLTELDRERMRLDELIAENNLRELRARTLYGEIGAERRTLIQEKGAERERQFQMAGTDPFRLAFRSAGFKGPETTPMDLWKERGRKFIEAPLPEASMDMSVAKLESILEAARGTEAPGMGFAGIGMAQGGVIEMERGGDGMFSMKPARKTARLVGEGLHGEGLAAGTAEVQLVEEGPFGIKSVEVVPFMGGGAAGFSLEGFDPIDTQRELSALGGMRDMPFLQSMRLSAGLPRLGHVLTRRMEDRGSADWKRTVAKLGVQWPPKPSPPRMTTGQPPPEFQAWGSAFRLHQGLKEMGLTDSAARKLSRQFGVLPAPHKLAAFTGPNMENLSRNDANLLLGLYNLAGMPPEEFLADVRAATPEAGAFGGRRLGWTGGYL